MESWSGAQRAYAVKAYYKNNDSYVSAQRAFRNHFNIPRNVSVPSAHAIKTWVVNFEETGSTLKKRTGRVKNIRTPENVDRVRTAMLRSPTRSARRHAISLDISDRSVRRILHNDLHYHPYKIQLVHALNNGDHATRLAFSNRMLDMMNDNPDLVNNLWMSDEAHFHLSGFVNKQNFRYWAPENPQRIHEKPLHSVKVTVWCAISSRAILGPYFFEDENGRSVTVNTLRYVNMLENFLQPQLARNPVYENMFFQQDGATCHTSRGSITVLRRLFPNHVISKNGDISWPARSPDLSACDYFLWGYLKSRVFQSPPPQNCRELKERIREEIIRIDAATLTNVMNNFRPRLLECVEQNGGHLRDVIFK